MTPADLNKRLGAVIREKRVMLGLSQEALSKRLGLTFQQVQKYEKGTNQVSFVRLVEIAHALGTSVNDLVSAALGEEVASRESVSDRQTLELIKRLDTLTPNQRRGVQLLVRSLAEAA
jgi:transcriptional regulator with XRE-family HTH domain